MSTEPLDAVQPGMGEGTYVSASPAMVAPETSDARAVTQNSEAEVAVTVAPPVAGPAPKPADEDYDPNVQGDFSYPPMPPQECCGSRPALAPCCYKRKMGRAYVCCERLGPNPKILFMCGAGWTTQIVTIVLVFGISFGVYAFSLRVLHWGFLIGAIVLSILACLAIGAVGCCDPGVFPRYKKKKEKHWRYCQQSDSFRPPGIQWCDETGVLIHDIDHFCPWSGTTIAKANMAYFHLFLTMVCVVLIFCVAVVIIAAVTQGSTATWPI